MGHPIHHLDLRVERCRARVTLNDVPVADLTAGGDQPEWFAPPINPYLAGADNMLVVEVWPTVDRDGAPIDIAEARVEALVVRVEKGEPIAPGENVRVAELEVAPELAQRITEAREAEEELELPQSFFMLFDNEGAAFTPELRDVDPFADEGALRDYAIVLRDLTRARDAGGLAREMEPKVQAYAVAYDDDAARIRDSLSEVLRDKILPAGPVTDFERDDVELDDIAGGRMWELRMPGGRPLIWTERDEDGGGYQVPIIVAARDGELKVVR